MITVVAAIVVIYVDINVIIQVPATVEFA